MLNGIWSVADGYHSKESEFWSYFALREENDKLKRELVQRNLAGWNGVQDTFKNKETAIPFYECRPAEVVNLTTDLTRNFITLNKGSADGFKMDEAIVSSEGIVGRIVGLSAHFSSVLPLINKESKVNCRLKKDGSYGSLGWNMESYQFAQLTDMLLEIPCLSV